MMDFRKEVMKQLKKEYERVEKEIETATPDKRKALIKVLNRIDTEISMLELM